MSLGNLTSSFLPSDLWSQVASGVVVAGIVGALAMLARRSANVLGHLHRQRVLVFVSTGGTCRDAMAKVIAQQLMAGRNLKIEIHAVGLGNVSASGASKAARFVIREMYGEDLLRAHRAEALTNALASRANLILAMEQAQVTTIRKTLPMVIGKTRTLKEFFGSSGDVDDPYREQSEMDADAIGRYRTCASELREILTKNLDHLISAVTA